MFTSESPNSNPKQIKSAEIIVLTIIFWLKSGFIKLFFNLKRKKPIANETQQTEEKQTSNESVEYNSASDDPIFG